jgi:hypothetical protein
MCLHARLDEVRGVLSLVYSTMNKRDVKTYQASELLVFVSVERVFVQLMRTILDEIIELEGTDDGAKVLESLADVVQASLSRGYVLSFDVSVESLHVLYNRIEMLIEFLMDLTSLRLQYRISLNCHLTLAIEDIGTSIPVAIDVLNQLCTAMGADLALSNDRLESLDALVNLTGLVHDQKDTILSQPLPNVVLNSPLLYAEGHGDKWDLLRQLADALNDDYRLRRLLFLRRLAVTTQAFLWSPKANKAWVDVQKVALSIAHVEMSTMRNQVSIWDAIAAGQGIFKQVSEYVGQDRSSASTMHHSVVSSMYILCMNSWYGVD